ncbi:YebC/PmpR family DNA-binding transcriptional regulator [Sinimarinibacterium sp. CAU 1509]|uniref:YebC/PmpR family DNA-binding transcriptional regulator n=1 Tax=Sinimarinibacterium sp. CAU 1509 TaxID=2562283 RepID=UPI0010AC6A7B|nr:YebC/PmpR family DNA-binding transcriptional regulator [Sinimarinibacterium sp. CAU 1509]TJY60839.1 YebC/PmpR family DNA-binding transcriptional regulator [Sinimarinibacterium sp. CAU 1509]
MGRGPSIAARKGAEDSRRGKLFTKFIREITVAARTGGGDPRSNARLRLALDKALAANMTKDTAERAIKRGTGELGADQFEEIRYEGYGPGGVAIMVDCMTDNPTRTVADVRHAFSKNGGNLGASGSVAYQFAHVGQLFFETGSDTALEEKLLEAALEAGADDVVSEDGYTEVLTTPEAFEGVKQALVAAGYAPIEADVTMRPSATSAVAPEHADALRKLIDMLEDLDDVQKVYSNAESA